jgi:hypothetical protein
MNDADIHSMIWTSGLDGTGSRTSPVADNGSRGNQSLNFATTNLVNIPSSNVKMKTGSI